MLFRSVGRVDPAGRAARAGAVSFERLLSAEGRPIKNFLDWYRAEWLARANHDVEVVTTERRFVIRRSLEQNVGFVPYTAELLLGDPTTSIDRTLNLEVWKCWRGTRARAGDRATVAIGPGQLGLRCWTTSCPLLEDARSAAGTTPITVDGLEPGSYLLVASKAGHEDQRFPILLSHGQSGRADIGLVARGSTLPGFVHLPRFQAIIGGDKSAIGSLPGQSGAWIEPCWIARDELSLDDYRAFMRSPEVQKLLPDLRRANGHIICPRDDSRLMEADFDTTWAGALTLLVAPRSGLRGVSADDALCYVNWLSDQPESKLGNISYRPPDELQWEACARGADGRLHSWGDTFDWRCCVGWDSTGDVNTGGALPPAGSFPFDESPFGVRDLMGGACAEWCRAPTVNAKWIIRGGTCRRSDRQYFHAASRDLKGPAMVWEGTAGFRLSYDRR